MFSENVRHENLVCHGSQSSGSISSEDEGASTKTMAMAVKDRTLVCSEKIFGIEFCEILPKNKNF